ncbi:hypothetical protein EMCG_05518 [[Emmonsia] crescens]|uniref:non-specific serine/threonine protein kinase n=1 Tax=[Emmonsia] crescens TaxID=73230 RepID=A0A0G2HNR7_9EURO|nr:hypothetical protein EMCG_05518 [Emmonsia crescens UAMH 3008]
MLARALSSLPGVPIPLAPRSFPTSGFEVIDHSGPMEEEKLSGYKSELYYPAYIGQVFNSRYQIVGKLGYGVTSTVWLARDLVEPGNPGYVVLKIYVTGYTRGNEVAIYEHINSVSAKSNHFGHELIRKFCLSFELEGPHGKHTCIVQQALGITMNHLMPNLETKVLHLDLVKQFFRQLLFGWDFLHSQAGIIHTDLQLKNLLLPVNNPLFYPLFYKGFEDGKFNDPAPRKIYKDRTVYSSRYMTQDPQALPFRCDFSDAIFDDQEHDELIMPEPLRAPGILLRMEWNNKVDIWSFAVVAWQLVAPRSLFSGLGTEANKYHDAHLLAEQHVVMDPAPSELARRSKIYSVKGPVSVPDITLEQLAEGIQGDEVQKAGFLSFIRRILRWLPEERPTAKDLFFDPWLIDGLGLTEEQV